MNGQNKLWDEDDLKTPAHDEIILWLMNPENLKKLFTKNATLTFIKIATEVPIRQELYRGFIIQGYIDLVVEIRFNWEKHKSNDKGTWCIQCRQSLPSEFICQCRDTINIEVKPKIDSFGNLLRQIAKYKEYGARDNWIIVTRNTPKEIKAAIESQGIRVIELDDIQKNPSK